MEQTKQEYRCFATGLGFYVRIPVSVPQEQTALEPLEDKTERS